jgi:hypothetical protein
MEDVIELMKNYGKRKPVPRIEPMTSRIHIKQSTFQLSQTDIVMCCPTAVWYCTFADL